MTPQVLNDTPCTWGLQILKLCLFFSQQVFRRRCRGIGVFQYWGLLRHSRLGFYFGEKKFQKKNPMAIFHFSQCEQELFYRYWDRLHTYLTQCASCECLCGKLEILHVLMRV